MGVIINIRFEDAIIKTITLGFISLRWNGLLPRQLVPLGSHSLEGRLQQDAPVPARSRGKVMYILLNNMVGHAEIKSSNKR